MPGGFAEWWAGRRRAESSRIRRIPLAELRDWRFDPETGDLAHDSGRFFHIGGLRVEIDGGPSWSQPIITQPEVGILGLLMRNHGGEPHFLMQAKMEPGNPGPLQLSPTVQATRSNYTRVHNGDRVRYLDYFTERRGRTIADVLQSEHGSWFFRKRNRNMVVEADGDVPAHPNFRWVSLRELGELIRRDNLVNMDARTVLSCLPTAACDPPPDVTGVLSWLTGIRATTGVRQTPVPLAAVPGWHRTDRDIRRDDDRFFRVVAVSVATRDREVRGWTQPMLRPRGPGVVAFVVRRFGGVPHVLVRARIEAGFADVAELGPTVQCVPGNHPGAAPAYCDYVRAAGPDRILYDAVHSEEGGRFYHAESRHLLVEADDALPEPPPEFRWVTPAQLGALLRHASYVNVQARTLIACLKLTGCLA